MPYCHDTPDPSCPICQRYLVDAAFRAVIDKAPAFRIRKQAKDPAVCIHLGEPTGAVVLCKSCKGSVKIKTFACAVHGTCTLSKRVADVPGCCDEKCESKERK